MCAFFLYLGTGKTFIGETLLSYFRSQGKVALANATTGIASLLLQHGRTMHSRFKIPLDIDEFSNFQISKQSETAKLIRKTSLIIWDDAPMAHKHIFDAFDRCLRDICSKDDVPFGGKTIVLMGDWRQVLPIVPKKDGQIS